MAEDKNIGFVCSSTSYGGLEINLVRLAGWMRDRGWNSILYCLPESPMAARGQDNDLKIVPIKKNWKYFDLTGALFLSNKLKADNVSTLILSDKRDISMVSLLKMLWFNNLNMIYQQQMQIGVDKKDFLHTLTYSSIDAWIAPLNWLAAQVMEKTKFKKEKIHVIPLGLELEKVRTNHTRENAREQLKLNQNSIFLGVLGRFSPGKRQDFVIKAFAKIANTNSEIELLILGESTKNEGTEYEDYLKKLTKDLNLQDKVHFRPFMDEVGVFFKAIDLFALPSEGETYGMVTIEAMAMGTPVIGTNTSGTPEILKNGELGTLFDPENEIEFSDKVTELFADPGKMKEKAEKAIKEIENHYTHHRECEMIESLIETL